MKTILHVTLLLVIVLTVSARRSKHGRKKLNVTDCVQNCKTCQNRLSCSVCEDGHALYKGFGGWGNGRCTRKCPKGYKTEVNPSGGNKCVKQCTPNCKTCQSKFSCSVCEDGHALHKGLRGWGNGRCTRKCPQGYKTEVNPSGGNKCVKSCTPNCKTCQGRSCSVCEDGHALHKAFGRWSNGQCVKKCPPGYKPEANPSGGKKCAEQCTPNCKTCQNRLSCSVCEDGHALHKGLGRWRNGRCLRKCPQGYKTEVNPGSGNRCVQKCLVKECESCPIMWVPQKKCTRCKPGYYKLSVGKPWHQRDFCFSHCPAGYVPKTVAGVAECQMKPETTSEEPTAEPEWTTAEPEPMTSEEPTTEPDDSTTPFTVYFSGADQTTTPEPTTVPEATTIFTDFWP